MKFNSKEISFEIPQEWIDEAGFSSEPTGKFHYEFENSETVFLVNIADVFPRIRGESVPIFKDGEVDGVFKTARERTVSILRAIRLGNPLPPVSVVNMSKDTKYKFKIVAGCHRFHCSIAAGYEMIPAVYGVDINALSSKKGKNQ